jgi:hypothetical protein
MGVGGEDPNVYREGNMCVYALINLIRLLDRSVSDIL